MNRYLTFDTRQFHSLLAAENFIEELDEVSSIHYDEDEHSYVIQGESSQDRKAFPVTVTQVFSREDLSDVLRKAGMIKEQEAVAAVAMTEDNQVRVSITMLDTAVKMIDGSLDIEISEIKSKRRDYPLPDKTVLAVVFIVITLIAFISHGVLL